MPSSSNNTDEPRATDRLASDETVFEFLRREGPDATPETRRIADETSIRNALGILVKLDPVVAELSRKELYNVFERGEADQFAGSIEVYGLADHLGGDPSAATVMRVTFPDGATGYYPGRVSDISYLLGKGARDGWVVAHLDETRDVFDAHALRFIRPRYLFDEAGTNRATELQDANRVLDAVSSKEFHDLLRELAELSAAERAEILDAVAAKNIESRDGAFEGE